jgi:Ring finger domain
LFGAQEAACDNPNDSAIYKLCLAQICYVYAQLCLPCLLMTLALPLICCCLPCFLQVLRRLQDPMHGKGATQTAIDSLQTIKYRDAAAAGAMVDETCPICLVDCSPDDELRLLTCKHAIHKQCADSWFLVSASCPTCRARILPQEGDSSSNSNSSSSSSATAAAAANVNSTTGTSARGSSRPAARAAATMATPV